MVPHRRRTTSLLLALLLVLTACSGGGSDTADDGPGTSPRSEGGPADPDAAVDDVVRIEVLSGQPDRVTGDDARIRITPSSSGATRDLAVDLDGEPITNRLADHGTHLEGVIDGLVEGTNSLTVEGDGEPVTLRLRAWPRQGPMISGPQTPLLACTDGLDDEIADEQDCTIETRVLHRHLTTDGGIGEIDDPTDPPEDVADVRIGDGETPGLVRVERGVVNRSLYEISTLTVGDPDPSDDASVDRPEPVETAGNGTLVLRFEDGCGATHGQGPAPDPERDRALLAAGFDVATATFLDGSVTCNDVVAAETALMVKERYIEVFGVPERTIGVGRGLGGGLVHLLAQTYPDLLDGGVTVAGFPDVITFANEIADCRLLRTWFEGDGAELGEEGRAAVLGHGDPGTCDTILERVGDAFDPSAGCDPAIPADRIHDDERPDGIRCTMQDIAAVPFGSDPVTGHGVRPVDNTGVQYGLRAFEDGTIDFDDFAALNAGIGGLDADGAVVEERMDVPVEAVEHLYETGRVAEGGGDLTRTPFIDLVASDPGDEPGDLHRALAFRDRIRWIGDAAPLQQIWQLDDIGDDTVARAVTALDDWLAEGRPDGRSVPDDAVSRCARSVGDTETETVTGVDVFEHPDTDCAPERLDTDPRVIAGAPLAGDVIKCELTPVDPLDYERPLTDAQVDRLREIFPDGVCDRQLPGAGQMMPSSSDRSFEDVETPADLA